MRFTLRSKQKFKTYREFTGDRIESHMHRMLEILPIETKKINNINQNRVTVSFQFFFVVGVFVWKG